MLNCSNCSHTYGDHLHAPNVGIQDVSCEADGCPCTAYRELPGNPSQDIGGPVIHPTHYNAGKIEVWDAIIEWQLSWCLGDATKYIARAGRKNPDKAIEDLEKAKNYINKEIERLRNLS